MSEHPELDRLKAVQDETQAAGDFVEWLGTKGIFLAATYMYDANGDVTQDPELAAKERTFPVHQPLLDLLAEWKGIDQVKVDREKRAILDELRAGLSEVRRP
jgi:hypothetical protein